VHVQRIWGWLKSRWRRRTLGELYLFATGFGAMCIGMALLCLPDRLTTGTSMTTLYSMAPRNSWGVAFLVLAAIAGWGALKPTEERFIVIMSVEVFAQAAWAVGLTVPSFAAFRDGGVANILAPIAWLQLASTALVVIAAGRRPVLPQPERNRRRTDAVE
jgi:hypothetical protein